MAEQVKVDIQDNSPYRVALELMYRIGAVERAEKAGTRDREYWLDLYAKCRRVVVDGWDAEAALEENNN